MNQLLSDYQLKDSRLVLLNELDQICDAFEAEWRTGSQPRIEAYLERVEEKDRTLLLRELLSVDAEYQRKQWKSESCHETKIGRYRVEGVLGDGGFARVYLGHDERLNRPVAIKVPHPHRLRTGCSADGFLSEAHIAASLNHAHILPVYDVGVLEDGRCFIVSKWIDGCDLAKRIARERLSIDKAVKIAAAVAEALDHAHRQGIVHRDVKPGNILLDGADTPFVTDFGLAVNSDVAFEHAFAGTPEYMSPEQARAEENALDGRCDLFSLGVVLYELLAGVKPFSGDSYEEIVHDIIFVQPPSTLQFNAAVPPELDRICLKAMAKNAADRYATCHEFAEALDAYTRSVKHSSSVAPARFVQGWLLAAACVSVLVIGIVAAFTKAAAVRARLLTAPTSDIGPILKEFESYAWLTSSMLRYPVKVEPQNDKERLHIALALSSRDPTQCGYLWRRAPTANATEIAAIGAALQRYKESVAPEFWRELVQGDLTSAKRLRLACILVLLTPDDARWSGMAADVAFALCREPRADVAQWARLLSPMRDSLQEHLWAMRSEDAMRPDSAVVALAEFYRDDTDKLCRLVEEGQPHQILHVASRLQAHGQAGVAAVLGRLERLLPESQSLQAVAQLSLAALSLGEKQSFFEHLRRNEDESLRTRLIDGWPKVGIDVKLIATAIESSTDVGIREALVQMLGGYTEADLPIGLCRDIESTLMDLYEHDADPGVHAAVRWVLTRWNQAEWMLQTDQRLSAASAPGAQGWYISKSGLTMCVLEMPINAQPSDNSPSDTAPETSESWSFALGATEITREQYQQLIASASPSETSGTRDQEPVSRVGFLSALKFCRLLSEKEDIPENEMCYPPVEEIREGMTLESDFFKRSGYRLAFEAEWEYACRGGTETPRYYGTEIQFHDRYAWHRAKSGNEPPDIATLKANRFGLFDMLGGVWEWCHDEFKPEPSPLPVTVGTGSSDIIIDPFLPRVMRGGGYLNTAEEQRYAWRSLSTPTGTPVTSVGFRVCRTIPAGESSQ